MTKNYYERFKVTQPGGIIKYTPDGKPMIRLNASQIEFLQIKLKEKGHWLTDEEDACIVGDVICFRPIQMKKMRAVATLAQYQTYMDDIAEALDAYYKDCEEFAAKKQQPDVQQLPSAQSLPKLQTLEEELGSKEWADFWSQK